MNPTAETWINDYLNTLPPNIRPNINDLRFDAAAAAAYRNGWTGKQAANIVKQRNYTNAHNPTLVAIMELERIGQRPPLHLVTQPTRNASGCIVCAPNQTCADPITKPIPTEWTTERFQLLRQLENNPDLTEDQRGHAMRTLIADQHQRP